LASISELIRTFNGGKKNSIVSLQMRDLKNIALVEEGIYTDEFLRWAV
jgi:hypothetical protein